MEAKTLNIIGDRATTVGNTWAGFEFSVQFNINGTPTDVVDDITDVNMQIRETHNSPIALKRLSLSSGISIVSTTSPKRIKIDPFVVDIKDGNYVYDILITFSNGDKKTYLKGQFKVNPTVTR